MKWTDPIRDFARMVNVQPAPRERGEHERTRAPLLTLQEPPLKPGFDLQLAIRLIVAALLFSATLLFSIPSVWRVSLLVLSALISGYDLILDSILRVVRLRQYDERILVFLVTLLAFIFLEAFEGAAVMLLYQFGVFVKRSGAGRIQNSVLTALTEQSQFANVIRAGKEYSVGVRDIAVGETIVIDPGERVAFDSIVLKGESTVDMSALTGDSVPVKVEAEDALLAGCVNLTDVLYAEVRAPAGESASAKMLSLIRPESAGQGRLECLLSRIAAVYTPVLCLIAVLYAVLVPLLTALSFQESLHRALILLLVAGSASAALALPILYYTAIGSAAKRGIIFKSRSALDESAQTDKVLFDQTGTLTSGRLRVSSVKAAKLDPETLLKAAAHASAYSEQPLARTIVSGYRGTIYIELIDRFQDYAGEGVSVTVDGVEILVGYAQFLRGRGILIPEREISEEISWYIAIAGVYSGRLTFADDIRQEAAKVLQDLGRLGCGAALLTESGSAENTQNFKRIGLTEITYAPEAEQKRNQIEALCAQEGRGRRLLFVSSSKNAPVCPESAVSAFMNCLGSDNEDEQAKILILNEKPEKIPELIRRARKLKTVLTENLAFVLIIKLALIVYALISGRFLWPAVLINAIADYLTILHASRLRIDSGKN